MRIIQLVTKRQRRGAEMVAADLCTGLAARGHIVHYAGLNPPPVTGAVAPANVVADDVSDTTPSMLSLRLVSQLARYLHDRQPDLVQANGGYALKYAVLAKRWSRGRWPIVYCNIGLSSDWLRRPGQRAWNRWLLRHAEMTAAVSEASRADLLQTYDLDPARIVVVRRGVALDVCDRAESRHAIRAELGLQQETPLLLHVGSFTPEKNHAGLLRIFERVRATDNRVHLLLVGDGNLRAEIEAAAGRLGGVHFLGIRRDVSRLMAGADLLLLPSLTEGIPGVILEAGAQSLPSIAYDVGGVAEAVRDGETGRLSKLGDEVAFTRAVVELLADPDRHRSLASNARALIESDYSLEKSIVNFERLYERAKRSVEQRTGTRPIVEVAS